MNFNYMAYKDQILNVFGGHKILKSKFKIKKDGTTTAYLFLDYNILAVILMFKHKETGLDSIVYQIYNSKSYRNHWMSSCYNIKEFKKIIDGNYKYLEKMISSGKFEVPYRNIFVIIADFFLRFLRSFKFRKDLKWNRWFFENILSFEPE